MAKSKFFRAFVEGNTISDGRKITADMIDQIVETFNADTYSPRINVEHIAGYSPEPPFNGYGTVVAVKAANDNFSVAGATEQRRALYLQVDGNDQLQTLAKRDQKPFPSVELTDSYAGSGKVGLVGLAFTDNPASIGTQRLQFSRSAPGTVFGTADVAPTLEFEAAPADHKALGTAIADAVAATFARLGFKAPEKPAEQPTPPANDNATMFNAISEAVTAGVAAATAPLSAKLDGFATELATLKTSFETSEAPNGFSRPLATGGTVDAKFATDC